MAPRRWAERPGVKDNLAADAREAAAAVRKLAKAGEDPIETRNAARVVTPPVSMTMNQCAVAYLEAHSPSWKNAKHRVAMAENA